VDKTSEMGRHTFPCVAAIKQVTKRGKKAVVLSVRLTALPCIWIQ